MRKFVFFLVVSLFFCLRASSDNSRFYDSGQLSCNLITKICQDARGFVWIATEYGLNKFDGVQFTQYLNNEKDTTSLLGNIVRELYVDRDKRLWVGCSNGLQYYAPEKEAFCTIPFEDHQTPNISKIIQLQNGEIWLTTTGRGIYKIDVARHIAIPLEHVNKVCGTQSINYIYEDRFNRIWISTGKQGVICVDASGKRVNTSGLPFMAGTSVTSTLEDKEGTLFITAMGAVFMFDEANGRFLPIRSMDGSGVDVREMTLTKEGKIYVGTYGKGLYVINKEIQALYPVESIHTPYLNIRTTKIVTMIEDRNQNLWLGCFQKGLLIIPNRPTGFDFWDISEKGYDVGSTITTVFQDSRGSVWAGVENGGLLKFNEKGDVTNHLMASETVISIYEDSDHKFWIGTYYNGLAQLDTRTGQCHFLKQFAKYRIKSLVEDSRKNLYISVFGEGLKGYHLPTGTVWELGEKDSENKALMKNRWINTLLCDSKDYVWIGHYKGISCYDARNDRFVEMPGDSILNTRVCYSLLEDHKGDIWIGTNNGLYVWSRDSQTFKCYSTENGLSNNVICGLAEDKAGNIWCSTFKGINQIKAADSRIINYYTGNGLIDKEYSRGVYSHDKKDIVCFGGNYGITRFSPSVIVPKEFRKEVMITNMYLGIRSVTSETLSGGEKVVQGMLMDAKTFRLSHEDNTFTFEFSTMDFREPENIHYEYRLRELGSGWNITLPGVNRVTYSHLAPGSYLLEVRACENGSYTPIKQVTIHIDPPWYQSTVAYCCYGFLLLALGIQVYYLLERKRREEINEAKLKFFINISHEIRSPMTLIISPLETLLRGTYDEATTKALRIMYKNANRIVGLINQLLDIRKIDKGQMKIHCSKTDMVEFVNDLFQIFDYQAERRNMRFIFEHSVEELPVWIDRNNFDKVLVNLFSNAFKYTPDGGEIAVTLSTGVDKRASGALRQYAEIQIQDTGQGIDESKLEKIFERFYQASVDLASIPIGFGIGLNLCRLLVDLHHGTIVASNRKDRQGSCFTIRLPLGNEHLKKEEMIEQPLGDRVILQPHPYEPEEPERKKRGRSKTNYKVLVIDDDDEVCRFLQAELGQIYKVLVARNGNEGLQLALAQQPDLIVSDVVMPEMDGVTLLKQLKGNSNTNHIPVILLTSKTEHIDRVQGLEKGADAYLGKPFIAEELSTLIASLIANRLLLKGKFSGAQDQTDKVKAVEMKSSDEILMERVMKVINDYLDNSELNVEMLAEQVGLSRVQLHRKLKELTGIPTSEFIRNIRLKQAALLLKDKKMNISQVAYAVGFTNHTHFSTAFKKFYGVSPTDYIAGLEKE